MKRLNHKDSIEFMETELFAFSNGLDQQIHGMPYELCFPAYEKMNEALEMLKKDDQFVLYLQEECEYSKYHIYRLNIDYFLKKDLTF